MELSDLYNQYISNGYTNFYIDGIGGPIQDDVRCLGFENQNWIVYYIERGQPSEPIFFSPNKEEAIKFYTDFVSKIEHWHLIAFTRSVEIFNDYKVKIEKLNIKTIQNDIPNFSKTGDRVYRLLVVNKDIFLAKELFDTIPYFDNDLKKIMTSEIQSYNNSQIAHDKKICNQLATIIDSVLTKSENKIWHAHPVWFIDGNPIVGYSKQKAGLRLMFWSGASFEEEKLNIVGKKFKDASIIFTSVEEINEKELKTWLKKSKEIQWDYKNIVRRKGVLERLK